MLDSLPNVVIEEGKRFISNNITVVQSVPSPSFALSSGPSGMTVDVTTGAVAWETPIASLVPYTITIRATNTMGTAYVRFNLTVTPNYTCTVSTK